MYKPVQKSWITAKVSKKYQTNIWHDMKFHFIHEDKLDLHLFDQISANYDRIAEPESIIVAAVSWFPGIIWNICILGI